MDLMQLLQMILHVDKLLDVLIRDYGVWVYVVLFAIIFCETAFVVVPFLPGDTLLFIAGAFAASGQLHLLLLLVLLIVASIAGNTVNYWIGSLIGHKVMANDYRFIDKAALQKTHNFYEKHGGKMVVLARFVPVVRTFAPFVAGFSDMTHRTFQVYNVAGAFVWIGSLVTAGYFFGDLPFVREHLTAIVLVGVGAAVVPLILGGLWKLIRKMSKAS